MARTTSVRPAPTRPASATISPPRTLKLTSEKTPYRVRPRTSSTTWRASAASFGYSCDTSRPTIRRTRRSTSSSSAGSVQTQRPSRITVIRWQSANTSSNRWEMNRIAVPACRSVRTTANSRSTSTGDRAAVGSSMTSTLASKESALAISTSCWSAMDRPRAGRSGSRCMPSRANSSTVCRRIAARSMRRSRRRGCRPMKMFSATDRSANRVGSW